MTPTIKHKLFQLIPSSYPKPTHITMAATTNHDKQSSDYDYDSSDVSFCSSSSISIRSSSSSIISNRHHKPHKSSQPEWMAITSLRTASSGQIRLDDFRILRRLGGGDLGNVYLCSLRGSKNLLYAMKVVDREALAFKNKLQRAETEKEILSTLDHPFLPTLYAHFDASHYSCLVMEFCSGGDLHVARLRQPGSCFPVSSAKFYLAETILALEYLHMMGVVYRDLKPENVLVRDDGHIMLSDFDLSFKCEVLPKVVVKQKQKDGSSRSSYCSIMPPMQLQPVLSCFYGGPSKCMARKEKYKESEQNGSFDLSPELIAEPIAARSRSFVGTHEYLAPEVISGTGHGSCVDWWTLGVFLYEMVYGRTPFKGETNEKTLINIIKQPLSFPLVVSRSSDVNNADEMLRAQDLIRKLLVKNPRKRLGGMKGSVEIKSHDFFKGVNWALIRSVKPPEVPRDKRNKVKIIDTVNRKRLSKKQREEPFQMPQHIEYF